MNVIKNSIKAKKETKGINSLSCAKNKNGGLLQRKKERTEITKALEEIVVLKKIEKEVTISPPIRSSLFNEISLL